LLLSCSFSRGIAPGSVMESPIVPFMCQEPHCSSPASSRIELLHACAFRTPLIPFIRLQQSHPSVHGTCTCTCTVSSLHSFTFKLLSFLLAYSEGSLLPVCICCSSVAPFLHLRGSHLFISTLVSSSPILQSWRVSSHHSFSFLHVPVFLNLVKILLALIHARLNIVIHFWILWRFCLPSFMLV